jgi:hypothetical protein
VSRIRDWGRNALTLLALASAGAIGASAATTTDTAWVANPDDQFLLDVNIRQLRLGEGVRAYPTPEGTCVVFGDFLTTLDVPMHIDLDGRKASGWAFKEEHRILIDRAAGKVRFGAQAEALAKSAVRDVPEGWCADTEALGRWFGIKVKPRTSGSALLLESEAKLPVELAVERHRRAAHIKKNAAADLSGLPQVKLPYRMWRAPALDFVVSGGVTYRASTGTKVDRRAALYAAGEVATLSYDAQIGTDDKGAPQSARVRAFRSDPDGGLLGPLNATHFEVGDVMGRDSKLLGPGMTGRGFAVTNEPLFTPAAFDRTRFEGELPAGWEAELYRNGQLLAFAGASDDQRYHFDDVQLLYGDNQVDIVLYGPQGQIRTRTENVSIGQENVPAGKTWYWAGVNQPGRDLVNLDVYADDPNRPKIQATAAIAHGINAKTSVAMLVQAVQLDDERLTYVEGSVRRSVGRALVEISASRDSKGGMAARAQVLTKLGGVNLSAEAVAAKHFRYEGRERQDVREARLSADAPLKIGRASIPAHADVRYIEKGDGTRYLEAAARLSSHINRFNLAGDVRYRRNFASSEAGPDPPPELEASLIGSGRVGDVRLRGAATWTLQPESRFKTAEVSAYWSASQNADFEAGLSYDASQHVGRARISHIRRFQTLAASVTAEAASDGALAIGFNLNFSLDSSRGFALSRQTLANTGAVHARVYRDVNDNGRRDLGEPFERGALITTGARLAEHGTDAEGKVMIAGLANYVPVAVGIDTSSLSDPMLAPKRALQVVVPRPGVGADVEIGLVGAGDIEGAIVRDGGDGFEGLDVELIDESGKAVATTRTDFDGFFLFERVAYGRYTIRLTAESARIAKLAQALNAAVEVNGDAPVGRMGAIRVVPLQQIALNPMVKESSSTTLR